MSPLLVARGAEFGYGGRAVVSGVDLEVGAGSFFGIVGPNGAGKTTLFRGLLGLIPPMRGIVERDSAPIGYVPQRETLDPIFPLQVGEVVRMGAFGRVRGPLAFPREECLLAETLLARVGLANAHARAFASLSGGERQRVLIARALMARPRVLLLDEPTSGVDRGASRAILELLAKLRERDGLAILLVSHQISMVRVAVERVLVVRDGRVEEGEPRVALAPERLDALFTVEGSDGA